MLLFANLYFVWNDIFTNYVNMKGIIYFSAIVLVFLTSCGTEVKKNYVIKDIDLTAEGPLFDGPNTLQANHTLDLTSIDPELTADKISSVKLVKAQINTSDSVGFDRIRNMVFQITAADAKLQQLALLNPVEKGVKSVTLNPSVEADIKDLFRQKDLTLILDVDLEGDLEDNLEYTGTFEFEVEYTK